MEASVSVVPSNTPLVFQLRELVLPGVQRPSNLHMTQSSCGGEDTYDSDETEPRTMHMTQSSCGGEDTYE